MTIPLAPDDHIATIERFLRSLEQRFPVTGVIHVGAHEGQEVETYIAHGCTQILLIEPNPDACAVLRCRFANRAEVRVVETAALNRDGSTTLHVHTSRTGSTEPASVLALERFKEIVGTLTTPRSIQVPVARLDTLLERENLDAQSFQLLNIDVQGAELLVLQGADKALRAIPAVLTEVHLIELYAGGAEEPAVNAFLAARGFARVGVEYHELYDQRGSFPAWGEALYVRG